jgi:hypothetical protein
MPASAPVAPLGRGTPSMQDVNVKAIRNVISDTREGVPDECIGAINGAPKTEAGRRECETLDGLRFARSEN